MSKKQKKVKQRKCKVCHTTASSLWYNVECCYFCHRVGNYVDKMEK